MILSEDGGINYFLLYSVDSLVDGSNNYIECITSKNAIFKKIPDLSPILPVYFNNYSSEYIDKCSTEVQNKYNLYRCIIHNIAFKEQNLEIGIEVFNGLGYRFYFDIVEGKYVCIKTILENFGFFYDDIKPEERDFFVGQALDSFNYKQLYEYFEMREDL